jgi:hypothetical protein
MLINYGRSLIQELRVSPKVFDDYHEILLTGRKIVGSVSFTVLKDFKIKFSRHVRFSCVGERMMDDI